MPQTVESISHARAAGVPFIIAINKIDRPNANPDRIRQQLTEHDVLVSGWGGDVETVEVSALQGLGLDDLLELILLRSEEHTSELQSRQYLVCRLLLEKKKEIN